MTDESRTFTLSPEQPGQSFEDWVRDQLAEIARISQEGGQLSPLSIDLDNLTDGAVLGFDATNELWTNLTITIPSSLPPPDADYGAITVSGGVWSIDADTVTYDIMQDATQECVIGAAAAGTLQELTIGTGLQISGGALEATGSGSKIVRNWLPTDAGFPASNYATLDTRNTHPILDFDATTEETVYFHGIMPDNYVTGDALTVDIHISMTTAITGIVKWSAALENMSGLDVDADSFATEATTTDTVPGTSGEVAAVSISLTSGASNLDGLTAGDLFRLRVSREAADGVDTASGDAEVHMVELRIQ